MDLFENLQLLRETEIQNFKKISKVEGLKPTIAKAGEVYVNTHNLTLFYIFDSEEKANSNNYWDEAILTSNYPKLSKEEINSKIDFIEHSSFKNNIIYSKNFTTVKITPGLKLELLKLISSGRNSTALFKIVGTDYYLKTTYDSFKYLDLDNNEHAKNEPKNENENEIIYAVYGTGNIYSYGHKYDDSIIWHWTTNIDDEDLSESQFKALVRRTAKRKAEQEFAEYDPNKIIVKFFKSREAFIKYCNTINLHPNMKNVDDYINNKIK